MDAEIKEPIVIDANALNRIHDIGRGLLIHDSMRENLLPRNLFQALNDYIRQQGGAPGFVVKL